MTTSRLSLRQRLLRTGGSVIVVLLAIVLFDAYQVPLGPQYRQLPEAIINSQRQRLALDSQSYFVKNASAIAFNIPPGDTEIEKPAPFCDDRFGASYLERLSDSATEYCTPESQSGLTCFHSKTAAGRTDSFCLARGALFNQVDRKFTLRCSLRDVGGMGVPRYEELTNYWYDTGPGVVLQETVVIDEGNSSFRVPDTVPNYTIFAKREGSDNIWHSLMEIFSMTLTLDVLRMAQQPDNPTPLFTPADVGNTQVLLLDDMADGPYLDLWSLFAPKPLVRSNNRSDPGLNMFFENLIIPLGGGGNPLWQGDWEVHTCDESSLLRTFSRRVLNHFHIDPDASRRQQPEVTVTFINRTTTRLLTNASEYFTHLESKHPHIRVQSVDFALLTFAEQLAIAQQTDVLVGVHGAGITHAIFLPPHSAVVEILPPGLNHKGFQNVAALLGHSYFSAYATEAIRPGCSSAAPCTSEERDWHGEDVLIEKDRFMSLMDLAVNSV